MNPNEPDSRASDLRWWALVVALLLAVCAGLEVAFPGYFWNDDYQAEYSPIFSEIARALRAGELPVLSRSTQTGGAIAGEFQFGIFSVFVLAWNSLVWSLGLGIRRTAAALVFGHLAVLALGVFSLARRRGRSPEAALYASLCTALSGWVFLVGAQSCFPAVASFAWIPWAWRFQMDLARAPRTRPLLLCALSIYLVAAAGWPYALLMLGVIALQYLYDFDVRVDREAARGLVVLAVAWGLGLALAAPALLTFAKYIPTTVRAGISPTATTQWSVPVRALVNLFIPGFVLRWPAWVEGQPLPGYEVYAGLVTPSAILVALLFSRRGERAFGSRLWRLVVVSALLCIAPSVYPFRWAFRWLLLAQLAQALFAAEILDTQPSPLVSRGASLAARFRSAPVGMSATAATLATLALCRAFSRDESAWLSPVLVVLAAAFWVFEALNGEARRRVLGATVFAFTSLVCVHAAHTAHFFFPTWALDEDVRPASPLDPSRRYLSLYALDDLSRVDATGPRDDEVTGLYPGNSAAFSGLDFFNGYSPNLVRGVADFGLDYIGDVSAPDAYPRWLEAHPELLAHVAIDGLVLSPRFASLAPSFMESGWKGVPGFRRNLLLERLVRTPRVQAIASPAAHPLGAKFPPDAAAEGPFASSRDIAITAIHEERNRVSATVANRASDRPALVAFARLWFPGYAATWNGAPIPLRLVDGLIPGIVIAPGESGSVALRYVPAGLVAGAWIAAAAAVACLGLLARAIQRRAENDRKRAARRTPGHATDLSSRRR